MAMGNANLIQVVKILVRFSRAKMVVAKVMGPNFVDVEYILLGVVEK